MSQDRIEILSPVGRLVAGDCFKGSDKDAEGKPLLIKNGTNAGQPRLDYFMALAVPKTDPQVGEFYGKLIEAGRKAFPHLFDAAGNCLQPTFSFKTVDGDSQIPNQNGIKPCDREGYPGHWIFHWSSGFAAKCFTVGGGSVITEPDAIKRGYYLRIYGSVTGNGSTQRPGIFLNHSMVELVAYGDVINSGPDGASVFGGAPVAALPPGATTTPPAPTTAPIAMPGAIPAAAVPGAIPAAAVPGAIPAAAVPGAIPAAAVPGAIPAAAVVPAPDFLNPPAPVEKFIAEGVAYTREQLIGFGWNDAQINTLPRA